MVLLILSVMTLVGSPETRPLPVDIADERKRLLTNRKRLKEIKNYQFRVPKNPACRTIDAVYLWVNGSDSLVAEKYYQVFKKNITLDNRLRDIPLLKYSIRALLTYAPFIRRVILVTNGQRPYWLNESSRRVRVVTHEEIFEDPSNLPTFNSNAIESQLWRIPGIAPCWFYFNDDFSLGRGVHLEDWMDLKTGTQKLAYWEILAPYIEKMVNKSWDMSVAYSNLLLNQVYYPEDVTPDTNSFNVVHQHLYEAHNVRFIQQRHFEALYSRFQDAFKETARHRLREINDTVLAFLYNHFVEKECGGNKSTKLANEMMYKNFFGQAERDRNTMKLICKKKPVSWCLNDKAPANPTDLDLLLIDQAITAVESVLEHEFPLPSEIENVNGVQHTIPRTLAEYRKLYGRLQIEEQDTKIFLIVFILIGIGYLIVFAFCYFRNPRAPRVTTNRNQ